MNQSTGSFVVNFITIYIPQGQRMLCAVKTNDPFKFNAVETNFNVIWKLFSCKYNHFYLFFCHIILTVSWTFRQAHLECEVFQKTWMLIMVTLNEQLSLSLSVTDGGQCPNTNLTEVWKFQEWHQKKLIIFNAS